MSHLTCTNCLQKSPADASRCKHCGRPFGPPSRGSSSSLRGLISTVALLAAIAALIGGAYWWWPILHLTAPAAPDTTTVSAAPPAPQEEPRTAPPEKAAPAHTDSVRRAPVESTAPSPRPAARPQRDSVPRTADTVHALRDSARQAAPVTLPPAVEFDPAHQRYARVFANLRAEPTSTGAVLTVLRPAEVVTIDSLLDGWYRVITSQQVVGYVDRGYLDTLPPGNP